MVACFYYALAYLAFVALAAITEFIYNKVCPV